MKKLLHRWHKKLGWWGLAAVLIWTLSAITHPIMSWFGPQTVAFSAPKLSLNHEQLSAVNTLLTRESVHDKAQVIKVVAGANSTPLLQITREGQSERDYYRLDTLQAAPNYDQQQARWLAQYYTGQGQEGITDVTLIERFSNDYPEVNRLLPVYKVDYENSTSAYVFTETNSLASVTNQFKNSLKSAFIQLHTFAWLNNFEFGRVIIVTLFMFTLMAMALSGFALVFILKSRKINQPSRRYHRAMGYVLWLPLLAWSASGFYHLLYSSQADSVSGLRLQQAAKRDASREFDSQWIERYQDKVLTSISVIKDSNGEAVYRLGIAAPQESGANRESRFRGMVSEQEAVYINPYMGEQREDLNDKSQAVALANTFKPTQGSKVIDSALVSRYGPDYDFRNKRLPVWKVSLDDANSSWLFVDPVSGILVDQSRAQDRLERLSFSLLHKWSHLTPFTGRQWRDVLIVITLLFLIVISGFGAKILWRKR